MADKDLYYVPCACGNEIGFHRPPMRGMDIGSHGKCPVCERLIVISWLGVEESERTGKPLPVFNVTASGK